MIKVILNRFLGNTNERHETGPWEMIFPIKNPNGSFSAPKNVKDYFAGFAFKHELEQGNTVLVNDKGGWNTLSKTDHIVSIWNTK
jgi:hypothetical protein